jgi:hypothetical protein
MTGGNSQEHGGSSIRALFYLVLPFTDLWYMVEDRIGGRGLNLIAKCVRRTPL